MKNKCTKFWNYRPYTAKSLGTWKMFDNPTDNHTDIEVPLYYKLRFTKLKSWVNNRDTCDLRCHHAHYDVAVMDYLDLPGGGTKPTHMLKTGHHLRKGPPTTGPLEGIVLWKPMMTTVAKYKVNDCVIFWGNAWKSHQRVNKYRLIQDSMTRT